MARFDDLFDQIRSGDPAAAAPLYDLFAEGLKIHLRRTGAEAKVDEMVYAILVDVTRGIREARLTEAANLPAYVREAANAHVAKPRTSLASLREGSASPASAEAMNHVLTGMSVQEREILVRYYQLGQGIQQIAAEMGMSEAAALNTKRIAREQFKRELQVGRKQHWEEAAVAV